MFKKIISYQNQNSYTKTEVNKRTIVSPYTNQVEFALMYQWS